MKRTTILRRLMEYEDVALDLLTESPAERIRRAQAAIEAGTANRSDFAAVTTDEELGSLRQMLVKEAVLFVRLREEYGDTNNIPPEFRFGGATGNALEILAVPPDEEPEEEWGDYLLYWGNAKINEMSPKYNSRKTTWMPAWTRANRILLAMRGVEALKLRREVQAMLLSIRSGETPDPYSELAGQQRTRADSKPLAN